MRIRTGYSFKTAIGTLEEVATCLKTIGWTKFPICDRNSTFGHVRGSSVAKANGLQPVYGVELCVVPSFGTTKTPMDWWTFVAQSSLRPLHDLIHLATSNPGKIPSLTYQQAIDASGVYKISGERLLLDSLLKAGSEAKDGLKDFFVGLAPSTPFGLARAALEAGLDFCATSDNKFPTAEKYELYKLVLGRDANSQSYPQWILSDDEWAEATQYIAKSEMQARAIKHRTAILSLCNAELQPAELLIPEKPKTLEAMCREGAEVLGCNLSNPVYADRLSRELNLIEEKKFEDYFYIIADMIAFAKTIMIVGPARGSSCGSLVCYLIGITTVDPIPFNLLFERFIDINRTDLPDIDIDFSDAHRSEVFTYIENKYGKDHVARLGTVGTFKPKSALGAVAKSLRIPAWKVEKALEAVVLRSSADSRALNSLEDTLRETPNGARFLAEHPQALIATTLEGHPANASQHAAGIIITQSPVADHVAVDARTNSAMCDKKDAEKLNMLKIDALGLTQLSVFERTLKLAGLPARSGYLETLPLDDQEAFNVLNKGLWAGIFQFNGIALQSITKQIYVDHIEDIISITALARPGPMASGGANSWVKRRIGREPMALPHELFEPYLRTTLGVVMYQEQVMEIGRNIGGLSWEDVTALRKAMSKSLGKEYFDQFGDKFKSVAESKGIPRHVCDKVWDDLCAYGSWAFNRSHSVAYGLVSYWCCWLKAHYPVEFAAATLDAESDPTRQLQLLRELAREGVDYVPVDAELSESRWTIAKRDGKGFLVGPLTSVAGIGPAAVNEILVARKRNESLRPALAKRLENAKTTIDSLFPVHNAIKRLHPNLRDRNIVSDPIDVANVQCGVDGDVMIIGIAKRIAPRDMNDLQNVAKRGGEVLSGPTMKLNMFVNDDSDEILCIIDRYKYEKMGLPIVHNARAGKTILAIKGTVPRDFRMISVKAVKYLGEVDGDEYKEWE